MIEYYANIAEIIGVILVEVSLAILTLVDIVAAAAGGIV